MSEVLLVILEDTYHPDHGVFVHLPVVSVGDFDVSD